MLLSEIKNSTFDINRASRNNTFGEMLAVNPKLVHAFKKAAIEMEMDGATYNTLSSLKLWNPFTEYKKHQSTVSVKDIMNSFDAAPFAVIAYFKSKFTGEITNDPKTLVNDQFDKTNDAPIYVKFTNQNNGEIYRYCLRKENNEFEIERVFSLMGFDAAFAHNLERWFHIQGTSVTNKITQFKTWAVFV